MVKSERNSKLSIDTLQPFYLVLLVNFEKQIHVEISNRRASTVRCKLQLGSTVLFGKVTELTATVTGRFIELFVAIMMRVSSGFLYIFAMPLLFIWKKLANTNNTAVNYVSKVKL